MSTTWHGHRQSGKSRKRVHILNREIGKRIDELNLEIRKSVDKLPAAAGTGERVHTLYLQVGKRRDDRYPEIRKSVDHLNLAIQFFPLEGTVFSRFFGKNRRRRQGQTKQAG